MMKGNKLIKIKKIRCRKKKEKREGVNAGYYCLRLSKSWQG